MLGDVAPSCPGGNPGMGSGGKIALAIIAAP